MGGIASAPYLALPELLGRRMPGRNAEIRHPVLRDIIVTIRVLDLYGGGERPQPRRVCRGGIRRVYSASRFSRLACFYAQRSDSAYRAATRRQGNNHHVGGLRSWTIYTRNTRRNPGAPSRRTEEGGQTTNLACGDRSYSRTLGRGCLECIQATRSRTRGSKVGV